MANIGPNAYLAIRKNGKVFYEHRVIIEQIIGRKLKNSEHIHHLDHNKHNNDPYNLKVIDSSSHKKLHPRKKFISEFCQVKGCGKKTISKNFCPMHYSRVKYSGEIGPPGPKERKKPYNLQCKISDCDSKTVICKGLCVKHYIKQKRHGDTNYFFVGQRKTKHCAHKGCNRMFKSKGYCHSHYCQFLKHGKTHDFLPRPHR